MRNVIVFSLISIGILLFSRVLWPLHVFPAIFWGVAFFFLLGAASFVWIFYYYWRSEGPASSFDRAAEKVAFLSMGIFSLLLVTTVIREITSLFIPSLNDEKGSLAIIATSLVLFLYGFFEAMRTPSVRSVRFEPPVDLPKGFHLRIVQVSDLHVGSWIRHSFVNRVANRIRKLGKIDLFVLTGDIGDGDPSEHREDLAPLGGVRASLGRFSVTGNHEGYWSESGWNEEIERLGFRILENESVTLMKNGNRIRIAGVSDTRADVAKACVKLKENELNILLSHQPKHAAVAVKFPVHLQLSGHTHAGQFLPWSWVIRFFHRHAKGLYRAGKFSIYVNSGTGFWGPPLRLGTRSEITLIEVSA